MNREQVAKLLAVIVMAWSGAIMLSYIFNVFPLIRNISESWVSMVFFTALCFFVSGIALYFAPAALNDSKQRSTVLACSVAVGIIMLVLLITGILGIKTKIPDVFVRGAEVKNVVPGMPAYATMILFILVALAGIIALKQSRTEAEIISFIVAFAGGLGVIGYLTGMPAFFYEIPSISTGMAFPTTFLFMLLGAGWWQFLRS